MEVLENILTSALERKPTRLSFETTYSHENIKDWLQVILPAWDIRIPDVDAKITSSSVIIANGAEVLSKAITVQLEDMFSPIAAVSEWTTSGKCRDEAKKYLLKNGLCARDKIDDFLEGACEPLAYYLSNYIKKDIYSDYRNKVDDDQGILHPDYLRRMYQQAKKRLEFFPGHHTAGWHFETYLQQNVKSPNFWEDVTLAEAKFQDFLFGHALAKDRILDEAEAYNRILEKGKFDAWDDQWIRCIPLYVLNYLFDNDELTNDELKQTTEETAQYSLHVVGLVMDTSKNILIVADPNGALQGGSNMEFLSIPITPLDGEPTTSLSSYDRHVRIRGLNSTTTGHDMDVGKKCAKSSSAAEQNDEDTCATETATKRVKRN
jgi:hypothetical protein